MQQILGVQEREHSEGREFQSISEIMQWHQVAAGTEIDRPPLLFPRVELDKTKKQSKQPSQTSQTSQTSKATLPPSFGASESGNVSKNTTTESRQTTFEPLKPEITINEFAKIDLRVGTIVSAEKIKKSNKLLKLNVDLGEAVPRQIIAGIAKSYALDDITGKQVVVVANLKPARLMGETSQGMILAGNNGKQLFLTGFTSSLPSGSQVK